MLTQVEIITSELICIVTVFGDSDNQNVMNTLLSVLSFFRQVLNLFLENTKKPVLPRYVDI